MKTSPSSNAGETPETPHHQREGETMTYGEMMAAAAACTTEAEAEALIDKLVAQWSDKVPKKKKKLRQIMLENIGYATGYFARDEAERVLRLFHTEHPIFGAIENWPKTLAEAFVLGGEVGAFGLKAWKKKKAGLL